MRGLRVALVIAVALIAFRVVPLVARAAGEAPDPEQICQGALPCLWEGITKCVGPQQRGVFKEEGGRPKFVDNVCGLCEIIQLVVNAMRLLFSLIGGLALVMFVWGGFQWLKSAGNEEKVTEGRTIMTNAVIGIVVVLGAWTLVNFLVLSLGGSSAEKPGVGQLFGKPWNQLDFCVLSPDTGRVGPAPVLE